MFLIDKYTPKTSSDVTFHTDLYELIESFCKDESIPHIIFYGPDGGGKKTLIRIFLEMLFDESVNQTQDVTYTVTGSGNKPSAELIKQSNYHIVLEPKGTNFDRYLIHDVVKLYAKRFSLNIFKTKRSFKLVLINNVDNLSEYAQFSLRRTMEIYSDKCRFIMWCKSLSKVIKPLRSRCKCLNVPAPSNDDLMLFVMNIAQKENIDISRQKFKHIIDVSNGNIKTALWQLDIFKNNKIILNAFYNNVYTIKNIIARYDISNDVLNSIYNKVHDNERRICINKDTKIKLTNSINNEIYKILKTILKKYKLDITFFGNNLNTAEKFIDNYDKKNKQIKKNIANVNIPKNIKIDDDVDTIHKIMESNFNIINALDIRTDYNNAISKIVDLLCSKRLSDIHEIRLCIFDLMITNIDGPRILTDLIDEIIMRNEIKEDVKVKILAEIAKIEHNLTKCRREIIHFDAFITTVMNIMNEN